jgi:hypothetical protein
MSPPQKRWKREGRDSATLVSCTGRNRGHHSLGSRHKHQPIKTGMTHTEIQDPPETYGIDKTAIAEALDPQRQSKASPRANEILCTFPEEYCYATTSDACDSTGQNKHAAQGFTRWVDGGEHTKLEDEDETHQRKRIETDKEERRPEGWALTQHAEVV